MLTCCMQGFCDTFYWTVHDSIYQIYQAPNENSEVIGTTKNIMLFNVHEIKGEWAKVEYPTKSVAYIKTSSFGSIEDNEKVREARFNSKYESVSLISKIIIFATSFLMICYILRLFSSVKGIMYYLQWGAFLLSSVLLVPYLSFCFDSNLFLSYMFEEHLFNAIVSVVLAPLCQLIIFWGLTKDVKNNCNVTFSVLFGVITMLIGVISLVIMSKCSVSNNWCIIVLLTIELCQIIQSYVIYKAIRHKKGIIYSILCSLTYFIGIHSSLVAALVVITFAITILALYLMLRFAIWFLRIAISMMLTPPPPPRYY